VRFEFSVAVKSGAGVAQWYSTGLQAGRSGV
jgi:hypothetical protein